MAFGSMLRSQKKTESDQVASGCASADTNPSSPYKLKLVQVLFRHGARTPLKLIPDVMEVKLFFCVSSITNEITILYLGTLVSSKAQCVPKLLEPPAYTHIAVQRISA